jgi:hypothetical protein
MAIKVTHKQLVELMEFEFFREDPKSILVTGDAGIGKTSLAHDFHEKHKWDSLWLHPGFEEPTDKKGFPATYVEDGIVRARHVTFDDMLTIMRAQKPLLVGIDDFGQAEKAVQKVYMPILLDRNINMQPISKEVRFLAMTNRMQDFAGVSGVLKPVKSRFLGGIYELVLDHLQWCDWATNQESQSKNPKGGFIEVAHFIKFKESDGNPRLLNPTPDNRAIEAYACPRTWAEVALAINDGIPRHLEYANFAAKVGEAEAIEFIAFRRILHELPNLEVILLMPDTAPIPNLSHSFTPKVIPGSTTPEEVFNATKNGPAVMFAVCGALVKRADATNFANIVKYARRIPVEYGTMMIDSIVRAHPALRMTDSYRDWELLTQKIHGGI